MLVLALTIQCILPHLDAKCGPFLIRKCDSSVCLFAFASFFLLENGDLLIVDV